MKKQQEMAKQQRHQEAMQNKIREELQKRNARLGVGGQIDEVGGNQIANRLLYDFGSLEEEYPQDDIGVLDADGQF